MLISNWFQTNIYEQLKTIPLQVNSLIINKNISNTYVIITIVCLLNEMKVKIFKRTTISAAINVYIKSRLIPLLQFMLLQKNFVRIRYIQRDSIIGNTQL